MKNGNYTKTGGSSIGIGTIVFIVLLILKLTGAAPGLTWFWVFFPLWIGAAVVICLAAIAVLITIIFS